MLKEINSWTKLKNYYEKFGAIFIKKLNAINYKNAQGNQSIRRPSSQISKKANIRSRRIRKAAYDIYLSKEADKQMPRSNTKFFSPVSEKSKKARTK